MLLVVAWSLAVTVFTLCAARSQSWPNDFRPFILPGLLFLAVVALVVALRAAVTITGERERKTWDALRLTPLSGAALVGGKLNGLIGAFTPHYLAYALPAFLVSVAGGVGAIIVTVYSLILAWPVMYYAAASGIRASAYSGTSWRSLTRTLFTVFVTGLLVCVSFSMLTGMLGFCLCTAVMSVYPFGPGGTEVVDGFALVTAPMTSAVTLMVMGRAQLRQAGNYVFATPRQPLLAPNVHRDRSSPAG
jgi:hypothetical protein